MDVSEGSDERFRLGIERFLAGESLAYEGVVFWKDPSGLLVVSSYSAFNDPESSTPAEAQAKIARSQQVVGVLAERSPEFSAAAAALKHRYDFCHDYGTGAFRLAWLEDGRFHWRGVVK